MFKILIFIILFSNIVLADDIKDFEIEGVSLGDKALNYFNQNQIKNNEWNYYDDKKFIPVQIDGLPFFETYDALDFHYKQGDSDYIIHALAGIIIYKNNIEDCYPKMDLITKELKDNLNYIDFLDVETFSFNDGTDGKWTDVMFVFESGSNVIACYDYANETGQNHLSVSINTNEFDDWLINEAYNN